MRKIILALSIFISINTFAQNNLDEVVYLKNGSVVRGVIIEQIPNQTLKIQTKDGSVFVYNFSEVQKITKEAPFINQPIRQPIQNIDNAIQNNQFQQEVKDTSIGNPKNSYTYNTPTDKKDYFKKGFIGITEIGALFGSRYRYSYNNEKNSAFSINQLIGKRTSQNFSIGMAFGVDVNKSTLFVPITIDTRIYFIKKRITPFLNIAPGYALLRVKYDRYYGYGSRSSSELYHTFITNFGIGAEFKISKGFGMSLNLGGRLTVIPAQHVSALGGSGFFKLGIVY